jgi:ribosomal protein L22
MTEKPDNTQRTSSSGTGDQVERADEEAARAAAAAEEAVEAASGAESASDATGDEPALVDAGVEAEEAADEATEAAETAAEAAEAAAAAPKPKRARKARQAEIAADEAEEAADEAKEAAAKAKPKRSRAKPKAATEEPVEEPAKPAKPAPARTRDRRRAVEAGVAVSAQAKYVRTSARKARLVCDHIRGKDVAQARAILAFTPRAAAKDWAKLLESAVANAEHNHELVGEELRIAAVYADEGPTLKRYRPRAMGRATRIRKRTSHLTITLTPKEL